MTQLLWRVLTFAIVTGVLDQWSPGAIADFHAADLALQDALRIAPGSMHERARRPVSNPARDADRLCGPLVFFLCRPYSNVNALFGLLLSSHLVDGTRRPRRPTMR
jgi:hypothetical protein